MNYLRTNFLLLICLLAGGTTCNADETMQDEHKDFGSYIYKSDMDRLRDKRKAREREEERHNEIMQADYDKKRLEQNKPKLLDSYGSFSSERLGIDSYPRDHDDKILPKAFKNSATIRQDINIGAWSKDDNKRKDKASDFADSRIRTIKSEQKKEWLDLIEPNNVLGDWVPSKPDRESNGGFGTAPDNGSPVPYRLNGHLELQRGLPWKPES